MLDLSGANMRARMPLDHDGTMKGTQKTAPQTSCWLHKTMLHVGFISAD
jgi:hypothetical protein